MTEVTVSTSPVASLPVDVLVFGVAQGSGGPTPALGAEAVAEAFDGALVGILGALGVTGAAGEAVGLPAPAGLKASVVLAVGLGHVADDGAYDTETLRCAAGVAARALAGTKRAALLLPVPTAEAVEAVALGGLLGAYAFTAYRTSGRNKPPVGELVVLARQADAEAAIRRATVIGAEVNRARDLVNTPANDLDPESFAAAVRAACDVHGVTCEVLDEQALTEQGFGGILGVGQGSVKAPRLVRISSTHPGARTSLALVGKGITYDSGGISLKPVGFNEIMKRDMSGAAAVFAAVLAVSRLGLPIEVTGWLALAENMPSGSAVRPGDVLRMYGGRTVEVVNTDAEGRLVLADALVRAAEDGPDALVDVATLTAAMRMGLGNRLFGVMSTDDAFRDRVLGAAARDGEQAWPMPLPDELRKSLDSPVADIANTGERMGGGLVAGLFLKEFVAEGTRWAHLDIAGPAFHEGEPYGYTPRGGTGCAVRTLVRLAQDLAND
ncbi:leucyl aminopeptidase [Streptomyces sp. NA04227]|uniref:leucyl aminopeptidase n=1 Tax=Streptomyces sp. NA04227 TaxID=2742136 RepID=UPI00159154A2|nr:leucyl aminopeptidase [Streptomyces sp. NA04227]QKW05158.1 leucyl aminopeptidase [Streptomyces sp. NA04227]